MFVKAKDQVVVISGKDKGAKGKVVAAAPKTGKVVVEGVAMVTKHQKANGMAQGGIVHKEAPIHVSNVMLVVGGKTTRVGVKVEKKTVDGKEVVTRTRFAKTNGDVID